MTQQIEIPSAAKPHVEMRSEPRSLSNAPVSIRLYILGGLAKSRPAVLCDWSNNGVGLISRTPIQPTQRFVVHSPQYRYALSYNSVCCKRIDTSTFRIGGRLLGVVESDGQASEFPDIDTVRGELFGKANEEE